MAFSTAYLTTNTLDGYFPYSAVPSAVHTALSTLSGTPFVQQSDRAQLTLPVITATITQVVANGSTATYSYIRLSGGSFAINQNVVITGCKTTGFNTNNQVLTSSFSTGALITAVTTTSSTTGTFTINSSMNATEYQPNLPGDYCGAMVGPSCVLTSVTGAGTTATYTYSSNNGSLRNGQCITIAGFATSAYNQTGEIFNLNTGAKTFQLLISSTTSTQSPTNGYGTVTSDAVVPGVSTTLQPAIPTVTAYVGDGVNATYTSTAHGLIAGQCVNISGLAGANNASFNGNWKVLTTPTANTFTAANTTVQSLVSAQSGAGFVTQYEIWAPNDGLTAFYFKIEWGVFNASGSYGMACSLGTASTNGILTNAIREVMGVNTLQYGVPGRRIAHHACDFYSNGSAFAMTIFRDGPTGSGTQNGIAYGFERGRNSSAAYGGDYVTHLAGIGQSGQSSFQQSLFLTSNLQQGTATSGPRLNVVVASFNNDSYWVTPPYGGFFFSPVFPSIGYPGNPMTIFIFSKSAMANTTYSENAEGITKKFNIAGAQRTYILSKGGHWGNISQTTGVIFGMRYE